MSCPSRKKCLTSASLLFKSISDSPSANGRISLGGSAGTVTLTISATDTANLTAGDGVYDLEIVDGNSRVYRILEGTYAIRRNISR